MRMEVSKDMKSVSNRVDIVKDIQYKPFESDHPFGGPGAHNGNRLRFGPDGYLWATTGDRHRGVVPQSPKLLGGNVLRIDTDGKAHPGNKPPRGFDKRMYTYGHRNVQGIVYLKDEQQIWSTEHGPNGGDEINLNQFESIDPINFGWPISSYGYHYASSEVNIEGAIISDLDHEFYNKAPLHKSHVQFGFEEPKLFFTPSIGISAIASVESEFIDKNVNLLFSSMGIHGLKNEKSIFAYDTNQNSYTKIFFGEIPN